MSNRYCRLTIVFILAFIQTLGDVSVAEKPHLISATPLSQVAIQLRFDQALDRESAEEISNYQIQPALKIELGELERQLSIVRLYTAPMEIDKTYTLAIKGVKGSGTPPNEMASLKDIPITLPETMEVTFGEGDAVTFSGELRDTLLIVDPKKERKNDNAGGEEFLLCTPIGGVFFVAFDVMEAFEGMGITDANAILDASISLYAESVENNEPQQIIIRRVLLPWKEGRGKSQPAEENDLTYNSSLHKNLPWNKPPAQAMLKGIDGDKGSDYNGSEDVAYRIDGLTEIQAAEERYVWKGNLVTEAFRFWLANPDYNYGYLFALRDGTGWVRFASKEDPDETRRPVLTIRYRTHAERRE